MMEEFTCASCGRLVHRVNYCIPTDICFECFHSPDWFNDGSISEALATQYIDKRDASYRSEWPEDEVVEEKPKTTAPAPSKPTATATTSAPTTAANLKVRRPRGSLGSYAQDRVQ